MPVMTRSITSCCVGLRASRSGPLPLVVPAAFSAWQEPHDGLALLKTLAPAAGSPTSVSRGAGAVPVPVLVGSAIGVSAAENGFDVAVAVTFTPTPIKPFIPAAACPLVVQRYSCFPFLSVTVSACDCPGMSLLVAFPTQLLALLLVAVCVQILKSCETVPLLVILNVT